ncbi:MAG: diguanylate cyclase [Myxococcota bacterium]
MPRFVLVADADPFRLGLLDEACRGVGLDVVSALHGTQVLDMIARQPPVVLVMHGGLLDVPCQEVIAVLQADDALSGIPILVIGECAGADGIIPEPLRVAEIQDAVRKAQRSARERRRRRRASLPPMTLLDPESGAGTRSQLLMTLDYELTHAVRFGQPLSCLVVGVPEGRVRDAAQRLQGSLRTADTVFRGDGSELVALLPDTNAQGVQVVCQRVQGALDGLSTHLGCATGPVPDGSVARDVLATARRRRDA